MEDVMIHEVVKGVLENIIMKVEFKLVDVEDSIPS